MNKTSKKLLIALCGGLFATAAFAKLPAPSEEAKAKADEAKAKAAWGDKVAGYKLCLVQDKVAARYVKAKQVDPKTFSVTAPACADPGPYVAPVAAVATPPAVSLAAAATAAGPGTPPINAPAAPAPTAPATKPIPAAKPK